MYHSITVGAGENHRRDRDAGRCGGVQVDRQLVSGRGLRGQPGGLRNILIDSKWFDGETGMRAAWDRLPRLSAGASRRRNPELEHDPEKWIPVFRKDHAQTKR